MSHNRYRRRQSRLPGVVILLLAAVVILVIVIVITSGNKPPENEQSSSAAMPELGSQSQPSPPPESNSTSPSSKETDDSSGSSAQSSSQSSSSSVSQNSTPSSTSSEDNEVKDKYFEENLPMLVNPTNKIPDGYSPTLANIVGDYKLEARAAAAFADMLAKSQKDGVNLWVVSAYRSHDRQVTNFNNKVKEYEANGYTAAEAYAATAKLIAIPGTSEHSLGYAVDLNSLYTSFEETKEFTWLINNCADFGFILRYPKDKVDITEISYEPWHYRYVGSNHARIIMEKGICLEEYLSADY